MNFNKDRVKELQKLVGYIFIHTLWMSIIAFIVVLIFARCNNLVGPDVAEIESHAVEVIEDVVYTEPPVIDETIKHPADVRIIAEKKIALTKTRTYYDVPLDRELQDHIIDTCAAYGIDPTIVISMIKHESMFNPGAVGDNGNSLGLMQIQPRYHSGRMYDLGCSDLLDPYDNVTVGIDLLGYLYSKGKPTEWVLMAYNGGEGYAYEKSRNGIVSGYAWSVMNYAEELRG